ncbi:hypothetical protein [Oryza sativa Japonica Group]|uniref:Os01g0812050 protein n=1 Tax=Oryza sativa subsp. japonica TaxID=39947 RepID=Q5VQS0_ORYSJ|nr:hypothetical protein [Oryza sativa Japonica Group]BAH91346.1 Os01g0812050 [Oryza sativa Japonica Group]|eukprot:NP_001172616.1 Os01g0812050 [Oryza sativa Japonica Group]
MTQGSARFVLEAERVHAMALDTKQVARCLKKVLKSSIKDGYRCVSEHPILLTLGVLLYLLYRSSPGLFAFLLSSSPVIMCTTLLLGILLSYGETNLPEADEDNKITPEISSLKVGNPSSDFHFEASQRLPVPELRENTTGFKERETKQTVFIRERASEHIELEDNVPLLRRVEHEYDRFDRHEIPAALTPFPSMVNFHQGSRVGNDLSSNQDINSKGLLSIKDKADGHTSFFEGVRSGLDEKEAPFGIFSTSKNVNGRGELEENLNQETVFTDSTASRVRDISEEKPTEGEAGTSKSACAISTHQSKTLDELRINTSKGFEDNLLDSSLGSPWARVGSEDGVGSDDGSSGFDSDQAESSSPDASMTDIAPILDEIDPLLGASSTHPDTIPKDDSDTDSHVSSQDHQTDDDSNDETDNNDAKENGEEKNKEQGKEAAFIWTADDEKNLMDLGYSEMERNRRLELLMARRRSRKNIRFEIDNDLIGIDNNDGGRGVDDLSRFHVQVPHISVPRRNPFDLPYDSEEAAIPGSAPSVLHTRKNPFDLPLDQSNDGDVSADNNVNPGELVKASHRDMFFRRHDSFNIGRTDATLERFSRFKPYFVPETVEGSLSNFQRQFSDKIADQEDHKDLDEKDLPNEHGSPALQRQDSDLADVGSECSDGINSVDVELDNSDIDDREIALQHFVFERSQEREAYLSSTKGKGPEDDYLLSSVGNSKTLHPVADLFSWEDGNGESSLGVNSSHNMSVEFSDWVSSPKPIAEHDSGPENLQEFLNTEVASSSKTIVLGARNPAENNGNVDSISYSNNEMPSDNLGHGSMEFPSEFCNESLPVISRDLHPIPEERVVENFNVQEKHEAVIFTDSDAALTGFHVIEEHFEVGCDVSPSSEVVPSCLQASDSIQSRLVENKEVSNPFISIASETNKVDMIDLKEETAAGYPLDSDDDADKIYPEPMEDNVIDESFLSELDAVGDFRVEATRSDQQMPDVDSHIDNNTSNGVAESSLISPQISSNIFSNMKYASMLEHEENSPLVDDLNGTGPEFGWSLGASYDDPEQTVYNPRRRILGASRFEETNTEMKPLFDETEASFVNAPIEANLVVGPSKVDVANESELTKTDTNMIVLDANSLEDIETAFKQASNGVVESTVDNETPQVSGVDIDPESIESSEQLDVIDAKSVDDIYAALKEHTTAAMNSSFEENEDKHGCGDTVKFTMHDELPEGTHIEGNTVGDGKEPEPMGITSSMDVIDAKSIDDIYAALKKQSSAAANSSFEQNEGKNGCGDTVTFTTHDELPEGTHIEDRDNTVEDGKEPEPIGTTSSMDTIEVKTIDDIDAVFKKLSDGGTKSAAQAVDCENTCEASDESEQH